MSRRRIKTTSGLRPGGVPGGILSGLVKAMADGGGPRRTEVDEATPTAAEEGRQLLYGILVILFVVGLVWLLAGEHNPHRQRWY